MMRVQRPGGCHRSAMWVPFWLALGAALLFGVTSVGTEESPPAADRGIQRAQTTPLDRGPVELSEFLCCGKTTGGTRIWGINYPRGWQVALLPNNPAEFFGALFIDPQSSIIVAYIPAATTVPGAITDVGNVDLFLNGLATERRQEFQDFSEIHRQPVAGIPSGRLWVGTWPGAQEQMWEAVLVVVNPTNLDYVMPGMPRGNLTMMGVRAASSEWLRGRAIYEGMLASTRIRRLDGGFSPWDSGVGKPNVAPGMVRFCRRHCDWIWVDADRPNWACPRDGAPTEPYKVPCR